MTGANVVNFPDSQDRTPTILIVDDEVLIRVALSDFLQECGFKIVEAANAAEAVEIIKQGIVKIDLIFSDVRMPGEMDGIGLANWVRENHSDTPVFLASGDIGKTNSAHRICAGESFFAKPYDLNVVATRIRETVIARKAGTS
jgi:CheY-like chemotaxis protein